MQLLKRLKTPFIFRWYKGGFEQIEIRFKENT